MVEAAPPLVGSDDPLAEYWANWDDERLAPHVLFLFRRFEEDLWRSGDLTRMATAHSMHYGEDPHGNRAQQVNEAGAEGQARFIVENQSRLVVRAKLSRALADPPDWQPVPVNSDKDSVSQSLLCKSLLDYYWREAKVEEVLAETAETAEIHGWAWTDVSWDTNRGARDDSATMRAALKTKLSGTMTAAQPSIREGDVSISPALAIDVAFDYYARGARTWLIKRSYVNRYDVAGSILARDPTAVELARQVATTSPASPINGTSVADWAIRIIRGISAALWRNQDEIQVLELRHLPTPACPNGRWLRMCGDGLILDSGALPYATDKHPDDFGLYITMAEKRLGSKRGYSVAHETGGLQEVLDVLTSIPYSNQRALAGNFIYAQDGHHLTPEALTDGVTIIKGSRPEPPAVLQFVKTPAEIFEFRNEIKSAIAEMHGLDNLSMGRDNRDLSGQAFALLDTRTQTAVGPTTRAALAHRSDVANGIVRRLAKFAITQRRVPLIVGKNQRATLRSFSADDLSGIDRIGLETTSGVMRSPAGRMQIADALVQMKTATGAPAINPEQYVAAVKTGKYEPLTEAPMNTLQRIRGENERLLAGEMLEDPQPPAVDPNTGQQVPVAGSVATALKYDPHHQEIPEHQAILSSEEARSNPDTVRNVMQHVQAHMMLWSGLSPEELTAHGIPPLTMEQKMGLGLVPPPQGPPPSNGGSSEPKGRQRLPSMPTNPNTGTEWSPTGALPNG